MNTETLHPVGRKRLAQAANAAAAAVKPAATRAGLSHRSSGTAVTQPNLTAEARIYALSRLYLGGKKFSQQTLSSRSDVHSAIGNGASYGALLFLFSQMKSLLESDVAKVLGVSTRTLRRQSEFPDKPMPADLASKAWLFAETLAKATEVFGGKEQAEAWMSKTATGLDRQRPIDLLQTVQGAELVTDFLTRLQYGVYS
jgi:putative toxin-antitoxin system antitoxin component (TIGR02293 family)